MVFHVGNHQKISDSHEFVKTKSEVVLLVDSFKYYCSTQMIATVPAHPEVPSVEIAKEDVVL
ncbi:hypothetical protein [Leptospira meyeri]|uniref:hypothetical protein n=1 Tax=Leptospira meyeri TaxID=29508 RepID=UPI0002BF9291|nr:hypothetical protein [Leptospira meyeri]EMJ88478.1 hypothetical protein LEP1GSC196_1463 [Leptospira meyeri serovar Semaranga str. Veldrot Semarang 173]